MQSVYVLRMPEPQLFILPPVIVRRRQKVLQHCKKVEANLALHSLQDQKMQF